MSGQRLLHPLVRASAARTPDRVAVCGWDGDITYAELDALADVLGQRLRRIGVEAGDRVGLWLDKSVLAVAAMQACLRIGAVYVPVDPLSPTPRANTIVRDAGARVVVTDEHRVAKAEAPTMQVATGEEGWRALMRGGERLAEHHSPAETELAYILYTSGSTGTPKGVCISHLNARAFIDWGVEALELSAEDRFSSHAPFHFDLSVLDLYGAFAVGACVCLLTESAASSPRRLVDYARREQISVWYSVPSALILMMQSGGLFEGEREAPEWEPRVFCFAGESFPIAHLRALRERWTRARFFNLYGPTETNVCTAYEVVDIAPERTHPVPIGRACSGDEVWVQTDSGERAGPGERGELYVSGPTVMLGYWGREPHVGPYPTGDIVRLEDNGELYFIGRRDHMVKVRGHRVELGEIEAALGLQDSICDVAVVVRGSGLTAKLVAVIEVEGERAPSLLALKRACAERLPHYMIIDQVEVVDALPRTRNGKIDRRALAPRQV